MENSAAQTTKRILKPLVHWMKCGDPDLVPVVMGSAQSTAASYFGVTARAERVSSSSTEQRESPVTPDLIRRCCRETGIHLLWSLGGASHADAVDFMDDVELRVRHEPGPDGAVSRITTIGTPAGTLTETFVTPWGRPACWTETFVKSDTNLPALAWLIERTAEVSLSEARFRERLTARFRAEAAKWPGETTFSCTAGVPAFVLTSNQYCDPATALYLLADHPAEMERLFEAYDQANRVWLDCAAAAGADITLGAINGLELYSPAIYEKYFIPQARRLHREAHARGMLGWVHTCGRMQRLIDRGVYREMEVDVLESLSAPPLGDVADLRTARAALGDRLATRGAMNVDLFYAGDLEALRNRTRFVLDAARGHRHMIGDTNDSFPPYPRENILALADEVRKSGRMFAYEESGGGDDPRG